MFGTVTTGKGAAAGFVRQYEEIISETLGFRPYPGTLNLQQYADAMPEFEECYLEEVGDGNCDGVTLYPCRFDGVPSAVIYPHVPGYPEEKTEILAPVALRPLFGLEDGDDAKLHPADQPPGGAGRSVEPASLSMFEAVVFDLDATLVHLAVDWDAVREELSQILRSELDAPLTSHTPNELHDIAQAAGKGDEFNRRLRRHEVDSVADSRPLPLLDVLDSLSVPVGICTNNSALAAEQLLDRFEVSGAVDAVVGRESVPPQKPDPAPLRRCLELLDAEPDRTAFIGDAETDAEAAISVGTSYFHPDQLG